MYKNRELHRAKEQEYRDSRKLVKKEKDRIYYIENKERIKNRAREYFKNNKDKINMYQHNRRKNDIRYKILCSLRSRARLLFQGKRKLVTTMKLLGCSLEFFRDYLELKFTEGMNWDNYGRGWNGKGMKEWHIDHIKPCSSFDLSKKSEQLKCFHYTNLQPLWARENLEKYAKAETN